MGGVAVPSCIIDDVEKDLPDFQRVRPHVGHLRIRYGNAPAFERLPARFNNLLQVYQLRLAYNIS